ncbi:MAG: glycosyltransferase family 39 protein [Deltaproteobacteria bacterium]
MAKWTREEIRIKDTPEGGVSPIAWWAFGIFLVALAVRLLYIAVLPVHFRNGWGCFGDTHSYFTLAYNLNAHHVFSQSLHLPLKPSAYKPPLYPFLLAGFFRIGLLSPHAIRLAQGALGSLSAVFVFLGTWWMTGRRADAVIAGLLAALCPYTVHYTRNLLSDWLGVVMFAAFLAMTVKALTQGKIPQAAASGLLFGLAVLVRPALLLFAPVLIAVYLLGWRGKWRQRLLAAALMTMACIMVVGLWTARNYRVCGRGFTVWSGGMSVGLLRGTWETAENWSWTLIPRQDFNNSAAWVHATRLVEEYSSAAADGRMEDLFRLNEGLRQLAYHRIKEHPLRYLSLSIGRLPILWWNHHIEMYHERDPQGAFIFLYLIGWILALPMLLRKPCGAAFLVLLVPILVTVIHLPAHCEPRFTLAAFPALCMASGQGFAASFRFLRTHLNRR